ncbi:MAG: polymer-forming cytoskeletal protein [Alphaproteobacteria bacterium]|nr:polymer-forming cytoskeletal protein [Alphaproteobacteria bacterium]
MNTKPLLPSRIEPMRPQEEPRDAAAGGPGNRKIMVVGKGINLNGEIKSCDRLLIEGFVEGTLTESVMLSISESGSFKGVAETDGAEIEGLFRGKMTVRGRLVIKATGRVTGEVSYGQVEIERGGEISGTIVRIGDGTENPL